MPTNYNEGTPRDPSVRKSINNSYKNQSASESLGLTDAQARKNLELNYRKSSAAKPVKTDIFGSIPDPWADDSTPRQRFRENTQSAAQPKGFEDVATEARKVAREQFNRIQAQAKAGATSYEKIVEQARTQTIGKASTVAEAEAAISARSPRPAIPGAGAAASIATLGIGIFIDKYAMPWLTDKAARAVAYYGTQDAFDRGKISEFELSQALEKIRNGNPREWGNRINEIRRIQKAALLGKKTLKPEESTRTFNGGQEYGVLYNLTLEAYISGGGTGRYTRQYERKIIGIQSTIEIVQELPGYFQHRYTYNVEIQDAQGNLHYGFELGSSYTSTAQEQGFPPPYVKIINVTRADGKLDKTAQSTAAKAPIIPSVIKKVYITNVYNQTPKTTDRPPEINKAKPTIITIPAGFPIGVSNSDGTKATEITPPTTSPSKIEIPHPRTIEPDPEQEKKVPPLTISNSNSPNIKLETSGSGPVTINIPGYNPITVAPGTNKPQGALPIQDVKRQYAPTITPSTTPTTPTKPGTTPTTPKPATTDDLEKFKKDIEKLITTGTVLAGLTPAIQSIGEKVTKISENTTPESLTTAAAAGTCRTTQPGGCTSKALDDAANKINQNTNDKLRGLDATAQAEQLRLLNVIDGKIGAQIPGGLSGFLQTAFKATRLDKIINALTLITALHNAAMLSRNLASTLGDLTSQALTTIGIKDEKDSPIDINAEIGKQINNLISSILGAETWAGTKLAWNKANTIISSATAITYSVRSLFDSGRQIAEWTAENTGKIGNALKKFRVVGENAYPFMPEQINSTNAWTLKIDKVRQGIDSLDDAASSLSSVLGDVQNIQQEYAHIKEQKDKFDENIKSLIPKPREENKPVADTVKAARDASKSPAGAASVFRGEGETPNA